MQGCKFLADVYGESVYTAVEAIKLPIDALRKLIPRARREFVCLAVRRHKFWRCIPMRFAHLLSAMLVYLVAAIVAGCSGDSAESLVASAKESLLKRDFKTAVIHAKGALQKAPDSGEARFLLGKALLESGDFASAQVELQKALDAKYPRDEAFPLLLQSYISKGQNAKVVELASNPGLISAAANVEVYLILAAAHFGLGDRTAAANDISAALKMQPDSAKVKIAQARLLAATGDPKAGLDIVDGVLAQNPSNSDAILLKANILTFQGQHEAALASYRRSIELRPDALGVRTQFIYELLYVAKFNPATKYFGEAVSELEILKKMAPGSVLAVSLEGQIAFFKGDFKAAREHAQRFLKIAPDLGQAFHLAGAVEYRLGSFVQAESLLIKAMQLGNDVLSTRRWLALTFMATGQANKAVGILEPVLAKIEKDADLLGIAGNAYLQAGNAAKAEELLVRATKLEPGNPEKRTALALVRLQKGDREIAFSELESVSASDKGASADMALIAARIRRGEYAQALRAIEVLEKKQPANPLVYNLKGQVQQAMKDIAGARKSYEQALKANSNYFGAILSLASLDVGDKRPDLAQRRFEQVLDKDPKNGQALLALAELKRNNKGSPEEIVALLNKAVAANPTNAPAHIALVVYFLSQKEPKKAVAAGQEALSAVPDSPELYDALGQAQHEAGEINQALATYAKLATLQPGSTVPHLRTAEIEIARQNQGVALSSLQKALQISPGLPQAQRGLAMLYAAGGKTAEALKFAKDMQQQSPRDSMGYMLEGDIHGHQKDWLKAVDAYRIGLKQAPSTDLAVRLQTSLAMAGKQAESSAAAESWIKEHPRDMKFRTYLGETALVKEDYATALAHLKVVSVAQPDNAALLNNLAFAAWKAKRPEALEFAERANKLVPGQPAVLDTLASILSGSGNVSRALELIESARKAAPDDPGIKLNHGRILLAAGKKAEARKLLEELSKLGDKFPGQSEVTRLLRDS